MLFSLKISNLSKFFYLSGWRSAVGALSVSLRLTAPPKGGAKLKCHADLDVWCGNRTDSSLASPFRGRWHGVSRDGEGYPRTPPPIRSGGKFS